MKRKNLIVLLLSGIISTGCNIFDPIDNPSGDPQLISAARACFDQGDFECALEHYGELASDSDIRNSEEAFVILDQQGIGMAAFMLAIGNGRGGGDIVTRLSDELAGSGLSETKRIAIHGAFLKVSSITDTSLRGLVRFASAMAFLAHAVGETNGTDRILQKTDLVPNATACLAGGLAGCTVTCGGTITAAATVDFTQSSSVTGTLTLGMVDAAVKQITTALGSTELGGSGKFSSGSSDFANALSAGDPNTNANCYHYLLISNGIGG